MEGTGMESDGQETSDTGFAPHSPVVIGLLGGIGSGKSFVAALLAKKGLIVLDADAIAHQVLDEPELRPVLVRVLGDDTVGPDGRLDRQRIADRVFADASLRRRLEELTHPRIRARLLARLDEARAAGHSVVLDVPLLYEHGLIEVCDRVLFVAASAERRRQRAAARGMREQDWRRRESSQADLESKETRSDFTVDNDGDAAATRQQLDEILARLETGTVLEE